MLGDRHDLSALRLRIDDPGAEESMSLADDVPAELLADVATADDVVATAEDSGEIRGEDTPENRELARRLRACVNACAGIPTEELERGIIEDMQRVISGIVPMLQEQRDSLQRSLAGCRDRTTLAKHDPAPAD